MKLFQQNSHLYDNSARDIGTYTQLIKQKTFYTKLIKYILVYSIYLFCNKERLRFGKTFNYYYI